MNGEPILGKNPPEPGRDFKLLTWHRFLKLRAWAQRVANHEQAPVYLVGSALTKSKPRDLDVSIIVPHDRFVSQFGPIPPNALATEPGQMSPMHAYLDRIHVYLYVTQPYFQWMYDMGVLMNYTRIDLKMCPDSWWTEKDKLLLASPRGMGEEKAA